MAWQRRWWMLYVVWIFICAALFAAFAHREDPSRRHGRILSNEAGDLAVRLLRVNHPDYDVVHVAYAARGEGGSENRWVVLCDHHRRSGLREAVVVELRAEDGSLLRIRKPPRPAA